MTRVEAAQTRGARWLVAMLAGVVTCFVLATAATEHLARTIADRADGIIANAMPSVQVLTTARGDLRRLELDLEQYATVPAAQRAPIREQIASSRQNIDGELAAYHALPFFPDERTLSQHVETSLTGLDQQIADFMQGTDPERLTSLHHEFSLVDEALERVVVFDAAQGQRLGSEILRVRSESRGIVVLLDAASVILAIGAAWLALRQLRRAMRIAKAEREARDRREAALSDENAALGQFAGRVAHDVLSPLATASLALELAGQACEHNPAATRATSRGIAAINRAQALVEGLLAFSSAGGHPEAGASTELAPVLADLADALGDRAKATGIALHLAAVPPGAIACSQGVLTSLVGNLAQNAIKYMGDGHDRRIDLRVLDTERGWRVEVEDTGPGIPVDSQLQIFQPHVQLHRGGGGIGLGLATVDRLVHAHGGSLGVISQPGHGALFWFELPKAVSSVRELAPAAGTAVLGLET
ncbi:MAG: ATP-binding protein [Kofleriaceae bacterium]